MGRTVLGILAGVLAVALTATTSCAQAQERELPVVNFLVDEIRPVEGETVDVRINIRHRAAGGRTFTIRYRLTPGTADAADYVAGSGQVTVFPNQPFKDIQFTIVDDDIIERTRDRFSLSLVASDRYELGSPSEIEVTILEGICDRTSSVRDALINTSAVRPSSGVTDCSEIHTVNHFANTRISGADVSAYKKDDFTNGSLSPSLMNILALNQHPKLTTLPAGLFNILGLNFLHLYDNDVLAALPEMLFAGLDELRLLRLNDNALITLPEMLFADLVALQRLRLHGNRLTALPPGVFLGLSNLRLLHLHDNPGAPFRLALGLEPDDETQELANLLSANAPAAVKLTLREGAPYPLTLALTASGVRLSTDQVTIPTGGSQSGMFSMTRITGEDRARIALSEPPSPPNNCPENEKHQGQCFTGFEITGAPIADIVYDGMEPQVTTIRFTSTPQAPDGYVEGDVIRVDVVFNRGLVVSPITGGSFSPTLALQIGNNQRTAAYVARSNVAAGILSFAYAVRAGDFDENGVSVVQNGLRLNGATVTDVFNNPANLANLGVDVDDFLADFPEQKVRTAPVISFTERDNRIWGNEGGTADAVFSLNPPPAMPVIVRYTFDHDTADADDYEAGSGEVVVPADATGGIIEIPIVDDNDIEPAREFFYVNLVDSAGYTLGSRTRLEVFIAEGVCDRTRQVRDRIRGSRSCRDVNTGTINGIGGLTLSDRGIEELKEKDFLQLTSLEKLYLRDNELTTLPERVFAGLGALEVLTLHGNELTTLPDGVFAGLGDLEILSLNGNELTRLPPGTFSGLDSLQLLTLYGNQLTTLPPGAFSGLSSLRSLRLHDNPGAPFRLTLGLEPADEEANVNLERLANLFSANTPAMVKLTLREGAPYPLTLAPTATGVELSADQVTIPAGGTRSETFTATRITGEDRVRITLSEPPSPPDGCPTGGDWNHEGQCFTGFEIARDPIINFVYDGMGPQVTTIRFTSTPQDPEGYVEGEIIKVDVVFDRGLVISPIMEGSPSPTLALRIGANRRTARYVVGSNAAAGILSFVYAVTIGDFDGNGVSVAQNGLQLNGATVTEPVNDNPANLSVDGFLADFPEQQVRAFPTISFEESDRPDEGTTVNAVFNFNAAVAMPTIVRYRLTPGTADAADYVDVAGSGEVVVPEGESSGTIQIFIVDDDIIERTRDRFDLSLVESDGYRLGSPTKIEVVIREGICDRTSSVRDLIINTIAVAPSSGVTDCADIHSVHQFTNTRISRADVSAYKKDDFTTTSLHPANIFILELSRHARLTTLPAGLFGGRLERLRLQNNALAALPEDLFAGLVKLQELRLEGNDLTTLPENLFAGLVKLQRLRLNGNDLTALPENLFADLEPLEQLWLHDNRLITLPPGTFSGLSSLRSLRLHDNPGAPFRLALGLEPSDETEELADLLSADAPAMVKLTLREGAPYPLTLALTASGVGLSTDSVTIPAGGTRSETFAMTRITGQDQVTIALSEPSSPPNDCPSDWKHEEQCFTGLEIAGAPIIDFVYDGMAPQVTTIRFTSTPQDPQESGGYVEGEVIKVDVVFDKGLAISPITEGSPSPTLALQIGADRRTATYVVGSNAAAGILSFVYAVTLGDRDDNGVNVVQNGLELNGATVTDAVSNVPANLRVDDFIADFPEQKVLAFPTISFTDSDNRIWGNEGGTADAAFSFNPVSAMPATVYYTFDHDTADVADYVAGSGEVVVPAGETEGTIEIPIVDDNDIEPVRELFYVNLVDSAGYTLGSRTRLEVFIAEGVCDRTRQVRDRIRGSRSCRDVNTGTINGIGGLTLSARGIEELKEKDFLQLTSLEKLYLRDNELTTLPEGVFANLGDLEILTLHGNELTALPDGVFANLGSLEILSLNDNELTTLPEGAFSGLGSLQLLTLYGNQLTTLPPGTFLGLSSLRSLRLHDNPGVPFRLTLGLEPADEAANVNTPNVNLNRLASLLSTPEPATVKLTLHEGAPYPLALALTASGAELSADQVTMPAGSTRSVAFTMTRITGGNRVTIALSEPPSPPDNCPTGGDWNHAGPCFSGFEIVGAPIIDFVYDGMGPQVTTIRFTSTPQDPGGYVEGEIIKVDVVFDRGLIISPITEGSPSPTLALRIGASRRTATYVVGSNVAAGVLSFVYAVRTGNIDDNGVSVAQHGLQLNGATITEPVGGNPANLELESGLLADFPEQKVRAFPTISFEESDVRSVEGETVNAVFNFNAAVTIPIPVRYVLAPGTAAADDYEAGSGEVVVPESATSGTIQIFIVDDEHIERTSETFSLNLVDSHGYVLSSPTRIEISIREGVCDRTPQVAEAIRNARGKSHCSDVSDPSVITQLSIVNNPGLTTLKSGDFFELDSLQRLDLNNNGLTTLPAGVFDALGLLTELRLNNNGLTTLPAGVFIGVGSLTELWLNNNGLTMLPAGVFDNLGSLTELRLNDNDLTTLPAGVFDALGSLTELRLNDNDLTTLPAGTFAGLPALRTLQFQNNQVTTWPASIFNGLSNLQTIDFGSNGITQLPDDIFADNNRLQNLLLGGNQLRELPEQVFFRLPQLRNLSVNGNRLTEVPAGAFPGYEFLGRLRLSDNRLKSLPPGLFSDLERANWLTFHNNRLTALPPGAFSGLTSNLRALSLGDNLGSPFQLKLRLEFAGEEPAPTLTAEPVILRATLRKGAPYALEIDLQALSGTLSTTEVAIEAGSTWSGTFTVTRLQGESSVAVSFADVSSPPNGCPSWQRHSGQCFSGLEIVSDAEFVLDDQPLSAVSGVAITSAPISGDSYTALDPNDEIVVELEFSGEIDVLQANDGSWPALALEVGDETRFAAYDDAASSTDKMVFRYKPQDDDVDDDGISVLGKRCVSTVRAFSTPASPCPWTWAPMRSGTPRTIRSGLSLPYRLKRAKFDLLRGKR